MELLNELISEESVKPVNSRSAQIMRRIESLLLDVVRSVANNKPPVLQVRRTNEWANAVFDGRVRSKNKSDCSLTTLNFGTSRSRMKFSQIIYVLGQVYKMLSLNSTATKRELYYQNKSVLYNIRSFDEAILAVCDLLDAPPWELNISATSHGLVYGPLTLTIFDKQHRFNKEEGSGIPRDCNFMSKAETNAKFILVVEKHAIFQKLIDDDAQSQLGKFIMITGKGSPDISTRLFLKHLCQLVPLPAYILVDANPYGVEIMCTYRFGSLGMSPYCEALAVPSLRWIGLLPSELDFYNASKMHMTPLDMRKAKSLLARSYVSDNDDIASELQLMLENNWKAEIEGIILSPTFLSEGYLRHKVNMEELAEFDVE